MSPGNSRGYAEGRSCKSTASKDRRTDAASRHEPCVLCGDHVGPFDFVQLPCYPQDHTWCRNCVNELFRSSLRDEQLCPPRCCRKLIDLREVKHLLSPELVAAFLEKTIEYSTVDRTYCFQPRCSTFIPPGKIKNGIAICPRCISRTCVRCKHQMHEGTNCSEDPIDQSVTKIALSEGWRQCSNCKRIIELTHGCHHMTYVNISFMTSYQFNCDYL